MRESEQAFFQQLAQASGKMDYAIPQLPAAHRFVDELLDFLFPVRLGQPYKLPEIAQRYKQLALNFENLMLPLKQQVPNDVLQCKADFFAHLPTIYEVLLADAQAILDFDPAAHSLEEIVLCYPGFFAISVYRLAHQLYELQIPILPRIMSEYAHSKTGIDIHPGANIGRSFFIDHGTGIVIGETANIGNHVKIYQGVTLGALQVDKKLALQKRHPSIEDGVVIYAGSTILGGQTVVGHHSIIGGNVWLTESVAPHSIVYHKSEVHLRNKLKDNFLDFVI